ncbi:MAG: hypothetical protein UR43_C0011G0032 [candidate division TM6 bacterium GW2011_GWF2_33_332]|nr:MAG: hypothetical protein UR43_C0011G0032 [candidate division TM6 bacterium GW2011_GWF2_33_332]
MTGYLKNSDIDRTKWDLCIAQSPAETIYPYAWYLDIVSPSWDALVLGDYVAVFPLTQRKKAGINYLIQPSACQQLGMFEKFSETISVNRFLSEIPEKFKYTDIKLNISNIPEPNGFAIKENHTYEMFLGKKYEEISAKYSDNVKRNIKKAHSGNLEIRENIDPRLVINLYRSNQGVKLNHPNTEYKTLEKVIKECDARKKAVVKGVFTSAGDLCAGAFFVTSHLKTIFLFSSTNSEARSNGAMHLLIDSHIKTNAGKPLVLDFEGSNEPGLARFYSSFGSEKKVYYSVKKNSLPRLLRILKK